MKTFTVRAVPAGSTCTLIVTGELDLAGAPDVTQLGEASFHDADIDTVVVDLAAVTFVDSTAIGALVRMRNAAIETGKTLMLGPVSDRARQVLRLTGLETAFGIDIVGAAAAD